MVAVLVTIKQTDFSLTDHIADRVIEKLDADYSPYGPNKDAEVKTPKPETQPEKPQEPEVSDPEEPEDNRKPWWKPWQKPSAPPSQ